MDIADECIPRCHRDGAVGDCALVDAGEGNRMQDRGHRCAVGKAISCRDRMLAAHPAMKPIIGLFKTQSEVPESLLTDMGIVNPSPNKVLRVVLRRHVAVLVPADAAMALVMRFCLSKTPSIEVLKKILANNRGEGAASLEL